MIAFDEHSRHEEVWLLLPWLATGRLAPAERELAQEHVRRCAACEQELAVQHLMGTAFNEPDTVTYAPGPSFRKLMDRIDSESGADESSAQRKRPAPASPLVARLGRVSLWRPPGLAWAASFLLLFGITGMMVTAYRWSQPIFTTHTDNSVETPHVLHIALDRSLAMGQVEDLLRANGARIVEGPSNTGELGVTPEDVVTGQTPAGAVRTQLRALSARLRSDHRVLWVQPLAEEDTAADQRAQDAREH